MTDRYETRATTHAEVCWSWGPAHYECAVREIERLRNGLDRVIELERDKAPFTCKYCGRPSWIDPSDQSPPPDYCHEIDHGTSG